MMCFFFFFQAEDGIRDLVRSRGLGDVYKRQLRPEGAKEHELVRVAGGQTRFRRRRLDALHLACAVSYTHLTLPTSDLV